MIVPMKKCILMTTKDDVDDALEALGRLGVVHVEVGAPPTGWEIDNARKRVELAEQVLAAIPRPEGAESRSNRSADDVVERVYVILQENEELGHALEDLHTEKKRVEPFGDVTSEEVEALSETGVAVRFFKLPAGVSAQDAFADASCVVQTLQQDDSGALAAVVCKADSEEFAVPETAAEVRAPEKTLTQTEHLIVHAETKMRYNTDRLGKYTAERPKVEKLLRRLQADERMLELKKGMGEDGEVIWLSGWVPEDAVDGVRTAAERERRAYVIAEPGDDEIPPTLIRTPGWVKPVTAVFDAIGITPGYKEVDVGAPMLLFLSLFFAMLVGDAGYGILFLIMSMVGKARLKSVPAHVFTLVNIMSVCTIIWGVVTGSWFGLTNLESIGGGLPAALTIPWLTGESAAGNIMLLTFLIGAVHLTIAHGWTFIRLFPSSQCWAQIGWILTTWTMFFAARSMVLLKDFPSVMFGVLTAGILLLVVFMVPPKRLKTEWVSLVMLPLNLISNFVDVVSYVRLFAVGAATFAVASAFNGMAMDVGFSTVLTGILSAFVLFFGHVLNILLAAMSVLVHGVRLNILEFAGHMGLTWAGVKYEPFVRTDDDVEHKG